MKEENARKIIYLFANIKIEKPMINIYLFA